MTWLLLPKWGNKCRSMGLWSTLLCLIHSAEPIVFLSLDIGHWSLDTLKVPSTLLKNITCILKIAVLYGIEVVTSSLFLIPAELCVLPRVPFRQPC